MVDAHVHLEKGSYCREWIDQFVSYVQIAIFRGQQGRISRPDRAILNGQF